jgi:Domain of unknown function (DUF4136)
MAGRLLGVVIAVTGFALTGCATMRVSSHVERGLDFSQYRTFDWGPRDALPVGDPRLEKDPFFRDQVEGAIEKQMAARGFERSAASDTPDVRIHYHASINTRFDVREENYSGNCDDDDVCQSRVIEYEAGTLVVDIVDEQTNRLIWRGWAQDSVEGVLGHNDRLNRKIDEGVIRMFARLPRAR